MSVDITQLTRRTLSYLKALNKDGALLLSDEIDKLIPTVSEKSHFKACHELFSIEKSRDTVLFVHKRSGAEIKADSSDLCKLVEKCDEACIVASTLGIESERYIKRIMLTNASEGVILDALFSSYLECLTDEYEDSVIPCKHTFRFAPGYGDLDISYNKAFYDICDIEKKLSVTISSGGIFLPQKSMLGIVGLLRADN